MDFVSHQRVARRTSILLLLLLGMAVAAQIGVGYILTVSILRVVNMVPASGWWQPGPFLCVTLTLLGVLGYMSWWRLRDLAARGGSAVAVLLGGRPLHTLPDNDEERTLVHVVEEMALASGLPVPWIYVLDREPGINAFVAGPSSSLAVLGVTAGALHALTRDELQAVVAHAFSHLGSGSGQLNLRLLGLLDGFHTLSVWGTHLLRFPEWFAGREEREMGCAAVGAVLLFLVVIALFFYAIGSSTMAWVSVVWLVPVLVGAGLAVLGALGRFTSRIMQWAITRQRIILADAMAVQFTRYPAALDRALQRIERYHLGSRVLSPAAARTGHFFFANPAPPTYFSDQLSSHPRIEARRVRLKTPPLPPESLREPVRFPTRPDPPATSPAAHLQWGRAFLDGLPRTLYENAHDPLGAQAVVFGLLLATDEATCRRQLLVLDKQIKKAVIQRLAALLPDLRALSEEARLPLVELVTPSLRALSFPDRHTVRDVCEQLAKADGHLSTFEICLYLLLGHWLDDHFSPPPTDSRIRDWRSDAGVLLSALAWNGHATPPDAQRAFATARLHLPEALSGKLVPRASLTPNVLRTALERISRAASPLPSQFVKACAQAVLADGAVTVEEAELLRTIAVRLNQPLPPLLPVAN